MALSAALMEDLNAANIGFALCPMLSMGAVEALERAWLGRTEARLSAEDRQSANGRRR